ncbi:alanine racemase [Syntrophorhabdus aromaticivorans]|uniref:Alanine racemase n=1 Tax=Syntrophorhabdus aromaticivorans TaxID=328301 RepID=A0A971M3M1_9BACT|nr:alanine racemase [Syntrophorhabdus aromaticivorans]NLW35123.1 alanine racemase [Syntrophorhabdus aromaticivorans]
MAIVSIPRAVAYIDLRVLEENYGTIKSKLSPEAGLLCVVKADAYGHGAAEVSRRLEDLGVSYLGVASAEEGIELRDYGIQAPILVMSGIMPWNDVEPFRRHNLVPVVYDLATLKRVKEESKGFEEPIRIHLKFDTGMGRLGFAMDEVSFVLELVSDTKDIEVEGIMSHFSSSERRDEYGLKQVKAFTSIVEFLKDNGITPKLIHMANSGAIVNYPEAHFNMARVGISLYGSYPDPELKKILSIKQVMKFVSKIALVREFPAGYGLSYGRTFVTKRNTTVAYVPVGYADGYPRALSNRGYVLIQDRRCGVIGRICMDWLLVDITDLEGVEVKDEVILLGHSDGDVVTADEIAELADTIPYEILCKISKRVLRVYV